jgi:hypothetical protein
MTNKPEAAAVEAVAWRFVRHGKELGFWCDPKVNGLPPPAESMSAEFSVEFAYPQSALDALRGEVERWKSRYDDAMQARADEQKRADAAERRVAELEKLMAAARRAIGDHHAPNDCYATGPLTGDEFLDLVQCPACAFLDQYDALTKESP